MDNKFQENVISPQENNKNLTNLGPEDGRSKNPPLKHSLGSLPDPFFLDDTMLKWFTKFTTDEYNELTEFFLKNDGIFYKLIHLAACRASRKDNNLAGLKECEFFLSKTEYKKLGLLASQKGKIERAIKKLVEIKLFEKIDNRTGKKNTTIYRINKGFMDFIDFQVESEIDNRQTTDRQQTDNRQTQNENDKNDKNDKNNNIGKIFDEKKEKNGDTCPAPLTEDKLLNKYIRGGEGETEKKDMFGVIEDEEKKVFAKQAEAVTAKWNTFCAKHLKLAKVFKLTEKRKDKLRVRFKEAIFVFDRILEEIETQPFVLGINDQKWMIDFDWLIENDTNYVKILERKYWRPEKCQIV